MSVITSAKPRSLFVEIYRGSMALVGFLASVVGFSFIIAAVSNGWQLLDVISKREYEHLANASMSSAAAGAMVLATAVIMFLKAYEACRE